MSDRARSTVAADTKYSHHADGANSPSDLQARKPHFRAGLRARLLPFFTAFENRVRPKARPELGYMIAVGSGAVPLGLLRSRRLVDKSADLLSVSNFAQSSLGMGLY